MVKKCLFYFGRRIRDSPSPPPALPVYPAGGDPSPQRTRNDGTRQAAGQTMPKPGRANNQGRPPAQKLDTLHRSALDARQAARDRSYRRRALESGQRVRNCADLDTAQQHTRANTKKCAMLRVQLDTNTKKCYYNARNKQTLKSVTPPQNRRTKP